MTESAVRVLIVDDSPIFVDLFSAAVAAAPGMTVAGVARDGREALKLVAHCSPDVIAMDLYMPGMDGLTAVSEIMSSHPIPILVLTGSPTRELAKLSFDAIERGALDLAEKPFGTREMSEVLQKLRSLARVPVMYRRRRVTATSTPSSRPRRETEASQTRPAAPARPAVQPLNPVPAPLTADKAPTLPGGPSLVAIVASTGGPVVLAEVLAQLPASYPAPILVVQHTTEGFDRHLASWLDNACQLRVELGVDGAVPTAGTVLIAPKGGHMRLNRNGRVQIDTETPPYKGHCPAGNELFYSLVGNDSSRIVAVVLTGMGDDGANGLLALRNAGALTVAQDAASSTVDGMPRVCRESGAARLVLAKDEIAPFLCQLANRRPSLNQN